MNQIADQIIRALDIANVELLRACASDKRWTTRLKADLSKLGTANGYLVYASDVTETDGGEWLYDVCWLRYEEDDIVEIALAVESEWLGGRNILEDFQKLCQSRAGLRLMVFQVPRPGEYARVLSVLLQQIQRFSFSQPDDQYILSCWIASKKEFKHKLVASAA